MKTKICRKCQYVNVEEAVFCKKCGTKLEESMAIVSKYDDKHSFVVKSSELGNIPFHMKHPELHLRPISEFENLTFWRNKPEYVENPSESEDPEYLYIAKDGKLGILYWHFEKHWYGNTNDYHRIIQCEYDKIEKKEDMFICHRGGERIFVDKKGNILR